MKIELSTPYSTKEELLTIVRTPCNEFFKKRIQLFRMRDVVWREE